MNKNEVANLVSNAIDQTEATQEDLVRARVKMAAWLRTRYNIAIKGVVINTNDSLPYMSVEFINDDGDVEETFVSLEKHKEKIGRNIGGEE